MRFLILQKELAAFSEPFLKSLWKTSKYKQKKTNNKRAKKKPNNNATLNLPPSNDYDVTGAVALVEGVSMRDGGQ